MGKCRFTKPFTLISESGGVEAGSGSGEVEEEGAQVADEEAGATDGVAFSHIGGRRRRSNW